jgi:hypothetical protein
MKKLVLLLILLPSILSAQIDKFPYEISKIQELSLYGTAAGLWGSYILGDKWKESLGSTDIELLKYTDVNKIDRFVCYNYNENLNNIRETLEPISTGLALAGTIAMSVMNEYRESSERKLFVMGNMYIEGLLITTGIVQASKTYIDRARPYTYNKDIKNKRITNDNNESFISGNASLLFYNSVFIAKTFTDIYPNSEYTKWVWIGGLALSCSSAYMSVQSGQHFLTDVITGAALGSLVGYFIPVMHYRKNFKFKGFKCYGSLNPLLIPNGLGVNLAIGLY